MSENLRLKDVIGLVLGAVMIATALHGLFFKMTVGADSVGPLGFIGTGVVGLYFFGRSLRNLSSHRS